MFLLVNFCLLCLGAVLSRAQQTISCTAFISQGAIEVSSNPDELTVQYPNAQLQPALPAQTCHVWQVPAVGACAKPGSYLVLEFWRLTATRSTSVAKDVLPNIYFIAAMSPGPYVSTSTRGAEFQPPLADDTRTGTYLDAAAASYLRPYQRLVIPISNNLWAPSPGMPYAIWNITVANLNDRNQNQHVLGYAVRGLCVPPPSVPCPRPMLDQPQCSKQGSCMTPDPARPAYKACSCSPGFGDYGCHNSVNMLVPNGPDLSFRLQPKTWVYYNVTVPALPSSMSSEQQVLVVELLRSSTSGLGGDPMLLVKPVGADNSLPWLPDIIPFGDLHSYFLQQPLHYHLYRGVPALAAAAGAAVLSGSTAGASGLAGALAAAPTAQQPTTLLIGILNNGERLLPVLDANLTLRARWSPAGAGLYCPSNCSGRGVCRDPLQAGAALPSTPASKAALLKQGFVCDCYPGFGGTLCEGSMVSVGHPGGNGFRSVESSSPGSWRYYVLDLDPNSFDYQSDELVISWSILVGEGGPYLNALLTLDEGGYPRQADYTSDASLRRGHQLFYNRLSSTGGSPAPMSLKGSDLKRGVSYVLGVYNSAYIRRASFTYQLEISISSPSSTWLKPYMSVVLGVAASVLLCVMATLCKRLLQRRGWGPWRHRATPPHERNGGEEDGEYEPAALSGRHMPRQLPPRPAGLPPGIVQSFPVFTWKGGVLHSGWGGLGEGGAGVPGSGQKGSRRSKKERSSSRRKTSRSAAAAGGAGADAGAGAGAGQQQQVSLSGPPPHIHAFMSAVSVPDLVTPTAAAHLRHVVSSPLDCTPAVLLPPLEQQALGDGGHPPAHGQGAAHACLGLAPEQGACGGTTPAADPSLLDCDDGPQCVVCLGEYQDGDTLRRLPCGHDFHVSCIDKWLMQHCTCPVCRVSLLPQPGQANSSGQLQQVPGSTAAIID